MSLERLYFKKYDFDEYNCANFCAEVIKIKTGRDITNKMMCFYGKDKSAAISIRENFKRLKNPINTCIVLMTSNHLGSHVGVWLDGKVMHLRERGVTLEHLETASLEFKRVRFYAV